MTFDFSTTKQINVKCSNPGCSHVYKIKDRREPVINDPGFLVMQCPDCHCYTRAKVWNVDYFKENKDVVRVYEFGEDKKCPDLSSVTLGEYLEEETIEKDISKIDLIPKISFWEIMGQKKPKEVFDDELKEVIDNKLYCALQASLGRKAFMDGVNRAFVKVPRRKNATKDYFLYAKQLLSDVSYDTRGMIPIHKGNLSLTKQIDGLYTRDECFSILDYCLKKWTMIANQVVIAVPFIGFHYNNKRCKNQVLYFWSFLNNVLDMQKTLLITRKSEFNKLKVYLNEQKEGKTYDFMKYWGKLNQLLDAATSVESKKSRSNKRKIEKEQQVFYTDNFHSKFYAGIYEDRIEVLVGSYNVHKGNVFENLFFKEYSLEEFRTKYLNKILPGVKLIKGNADVIRALLFEVKGSEVSCDIKDLKDVIEG
jgi:hypothetical protein